MKIGNLDIKKAYLGNNELTHDNAFVGEHHVIDTPPTLDYLTFTAKEAGSTVKYNAFTGTTAEYSLDGGTTWTDAVGVTVTLDNIGDSVKYRGTITENISARNGRFTMTGLITASGSIMSMYNKDPNDKEIIYNRAFAWMFRYCTALTTAPELPATTLSNNCYEELFRGCTALTTAPELPATTLKEYCYSRLFYGCSALTSAPELPATTQDSRVYYEMFRNCISLAYVKHHVTDWNTYNTEYWLANTAASGVVECPTASTIPSDSTSGIPTGWTRVNF